MSLKEKGGKVSGQYRLIVILGPNLSSGPSSTHVFHRELLASERRPATYKTYRLLRFVNSIRIKALSQPTLPTVEINYNSVTVIQPGKSYVASHLQNGRSQSPNVCPPMLSEPIPFATWTDFPHSTNLIIILGMMQVSKRIPMDDPQTLMLVRAGYILSNVIIISVYAYTHFIINKKKGKLLLADVRAG